MMTSAAALEHKRRHVLRERHSARVCGARRYRTLLRLNASMEACSTGRARTRRHNYRGHDERQTDGGHGPRTLENHVTTGKCGVPARPSAHAARARGVADPERVPREESGRGNQTLVLGGAWSRRNWISSVLTFSGCSCCTQCPAPSTRWKPTMRVHAVVRILSAAPGV